MIDLEECLADLDGDGELSPSDILATAQAHLGRENATPEDLAKAEYVAGRSLLVMGRLSEAVDAFRNSYDLAPSGAVTETSTQSLLDHSVSLQYLGKHDEAADSLVAALDFAESIADPKILARAHYAVAAMWNSLQAHRLCSQSARAAVSYATHAGDASIETQASMAIALSLSELGQHEAASMWTGRAVDVCDRHELHRLRHYATITGLYLQHRANAASVSTTEFADLLRKAQTFPLPVVVSLQLDLAEIYLDQGQLRNAQDVLRAIDPDADATGIPTNQLRYLRLSAELAGAQGDDSTAANLLRRLLQADEERRGPGLEAPLAALTRWAARDRRNDANRLQEFWSAETEAIAAQRQIDAGIAQQVEGLAHDIKTPLMALALSAERLRDLVADSGDPEVSRAAAVIEACAVEARQLAADIQHVAGDRLASIRLRADIDPGKVVRAVAEVCKPLADRRLITLDVERDIPSVIVGDELALRRVVQNLLDNAIKSSPIGATISVRTLVAAHHTRIRVSDTGPGLSLGELDLAFERQASRTARSSNPQSGLGLFIVERLVRELDGAVEVHLGQEGTTVELVLPSTPTNSTSRKSSETDS